MARTIASVTNIIDISSALLEADIQLSDFQKTHLERIHQTSIDLVTEYFLYETSSIATLMLYIEIKASEDITTILQASSDLLVSSKFTSLLTRDAISEIYKVAIYTKYQFEVLLNDLVTITQQMNLRDLADFTQQPFDLDTTHISKPIQVSPSSPFTIPVDEYEDLDSVFDSSISDFDPIILEEESTIEQTDVSPKIINDLFTDGIEDEQTLYELDYPHQKAKSNKVLDRLKEIVVSLVWLTIPIFCLALWLYYLPMVDPYQMTDLGIIPAMPPLMFIAPIAMIIAFCIHLYEPKEHILFIYLVTIIFMLYHLVYAISEVPGFSTTWVHLGFVENIMRRSINDVRLDARMSWPGFFAMGGFLTQSTGYNLGIPFVGYATFFMNLFFLGPLYLIYSGLTSNIRLVWFSLLIFYLTNWIGQDYYAPQALNFLFYITIIGVLLYWFKAHQNGEDNKNNLMWFGDYLDTSLVKLGNTNKVINWITTRIRDFFFSAESANESTNRFQRSAFVFYLFILMAAMVGSHQLTPFFTFLTLTAFVLFRRVQLNGINFLTGLLTSAWIVYMTTAYLAGNLSDLISDLGSLGSIFEANVAERLSIPVSDERQLILNIRLYATLLIWLIAGIGILWQFITRRWKPIAIFLMVMPFLVMALQNYGGEGLLRVYFFTLVGVAFIVSDLFFEDKSGYVKKQTIIAVMLFALLLFSSFMFTRYGNEKMNFFPRSDIDGLLYLHDIAPTNSLFLTYTWNGAQRMKNIEKHDFILFQQEYDEITLDDLVRTMQQEQYAESYLFMTQAGLAAGELFWGLQEGWQNELAIQLDDSPYFELIYTNNEFRLYALSAAGEEIDVSDATIID